ncbi:MAG TPA: tryptophan 7-halogenase [Woeseiaceae bacterium]
MSGQAGLERVQRIVIVGSGVAAWAAAASLAKVLGPAGRLRVVPAAETADAGYGGADSLLPLHDERLGCLRDAAAMLTAGDGSCGWGVAFDGWSPHARPWFLPFGSIGAGLGPVPFHQIVLRLRREGRAVRLADYSLPALAAQSGRFAWPGGPARSVLSTCRNALHLDVAALADALRERAGAAGVMSSRAPFASAERAGDGRIAGIHTADGTRLGADLVLDCSETAVLSGRDPWEDWSPWLACDRALAARVPRAADPPPYALAEAHAAGWTRHLPLAHATSLVAFFNAARGGEAAALASLERAGLAAEPDNVPLRFGRRREPWRGNCVALGAAAARLDPLVVGNLHFLLTALARLLELLPAEPRSPACAREYNRRTAAELDNARDQAIALYKTNGRRGEPFWDECRAMAVPDSLAYRLDTYASRGKVVLYDEEPFDEAAWIALFDEQGIAPPRNHPLADGFPIADLEAHLARIRAILLDELKRMPAHADHLARVRAAERRPDNAAREALP